MHPATSVIFFTVTSGAGFGLIFLVGLGFGFPADAATVFLICALAAGLAAAGLISSTFHLGHPERAWRALSQWRSSWLSREGVLAIATLSVFAVYSVLWIFSGERIAALGWITSVLALATVFATAMIYSQLKTVPQWNTWLTPISYLGFGLASGLTLAGACGANIGSGPLDLPVLALLVLLTVWAIKVAWWQRASREDFHTTGSNTGTATGLASIGKVRLLERPHIEDNYLTREMVHKVGRRHASRLRLIALVAGCGIPVILCAIAALSGNQDIPLALAAISLGLGLLVERWLFFAEARHSVSLYY